MYKLHYDPLSQKTSVELVGANLHIPFDPANTDYQEYLKWLEEGGVPEAADDVPAQ